MTLLAVYIVIAVFTSILAQSKGRDPLGWFVLGALFSFMAFLLVACMPALDRTFRPAPRSGLGVVLICGALIGVGLLLGHH